MRTSTVLFMVIFLCIASSHEQRDRIRGLLGDVRGFVHDATAPDATWARKLKGGSCRAARSPEAQALKETLAEADSRAEAASRARRAVDRSIRQLEDRLKELSRETRSRAARGAINDSIELLVRQVDELNAERESLDDLQTAIKNEQAQLRAAYELACVRAERAAVEKALGRHASSPLERLAVSER